MMIRIGSVFLLCATLFAATGCQEPGNRPKAPGRDGVSRTTSLRSHLGDRCKVQFRRDALGAAASNPVPPTTDNINGVDVSMVGTLTDVTPEAVVVSYGGTNERDHWIPINSILFIQFDIPTENTSGSGQH